jgi:lycopene beta-cyclase
VVYKTWEELWFHSEDYTTKYKIAPYRYKMIRSLDLYKYCMDIISQSPSVSVYYGEIEKIWLEDYGAIINMQDGEQFHSTFVFNSIIFSEPVLQKKQNSFLQHFKGWVIETAQPIFNEREATLMDFRISQKKATSFVYVMPFSSTRALVEYTLFSKEILQTAEYDLALRNYIEQFLGTTDYTVREEEYGIIPMTNYQFPFRDGNIVNIGTAGGQTKASTGYTFRFIQKQCKLIIESLETNHHPFLTNDVLHKRFNWYDSTLLNVLSNNKLPGSFIFSELFRKNKITNVLRFLDNETNLLQEMKVINVLPKRIFFKAAFEEL